MLKIGQYYRSKSIEISYVYCVDLIIADRYKCNIMYRGRTYEATYTEDGEFIMFNSLALALDTEEMDLVGPLKEDSCLHGNYVNAGFNMIHMVCIYCGKDKDECQTTLDCTWGLCE